MKFKKYISKHFLLRFSLLLMLVGSAALFDMYHASKQSLADSLQKEPKQDESETNKVFYYNQSPINSFKTPVSDFSVRFKHACTQNKFLRKHYNLRTFQIMKAEALHQLNPSVHSFHAFPYNRVIYTKSDDTPPLS